ncbi:hypothetical protein LTR70_005768 [Exophiala xenobiotica]|uniref:DUF1014-domain-containing protein n=1 Tax=Lithohypha guttulata TaxID=1690604 RepID=A0ABR0K8Z4_9EURO|nr:hypothetical protein LTR24_005505 [Lithohypha guttulata]KAK5317662.1 hypothetical protein LTR70_005768 [Exophiala xenobiotica]
MTRDFLVIIANEHYFEIILPNLMSHRIWRAFSPTQYIRIFIIVNITTFATARGIMGGKKGGENTKKVAGNAKKAEAASKKQAEDDARNAAAESQKWDKGAKDEAKKADAASKKAEAAAKKAERDRLLAEEEASQRAAPKGANKKTAEKKSKGTLDLSQLDDEPTSRKAATLNASGIENALDALDLTADSNQVKLERHPERRYKAAYTQFEARRLPEIEQEHPGLRKNQRVEICRKEFEKSPDNPFNQVGNVRYDASKDDLASEKVRIRSGVETRLGEK